jgi:DNA-binding response OmpR family regulator
MRKRILLIEDNESDANMFREYLKKEGLNVQVSMTGEDGLKKAQKMKPDLILLDLILPDIDGFEVCEDIKKDEKFRDTKIIIISVKGDVEKVGRVLRVGADDYIVKTLVDEIPDDLMDKIKLHLKLK